jgi:hypothetical protein
LFSWFFWFFGFLLFLVASTSASTQSCIAFCHFCDTLVGLAMMLVKKLATVLATMIYLLSLYLAKRSCSDGADNGAIPFGVRSIARVGLNR